MVIIQNTSGAFCAASAEDSGGALSLGKVELHYGATQPSAFERHQASLAAPFEYGVISRLVWLGDDRFGRRHYMPLEPVDREQLPWAGAA